MNQDLPELAVKVLHEVGVQLFLPAFDILNFVEEFEVDLVGQEVVLGRACVILEEGIVLAISFLFHVPFGLLLHVLELGVQQPLEAIVFELLQVGVEVLPAVFDPVEPGLAVLLGALDVVDLAVVVAVDAVLEVAGEAGLGMLVLPQIAQLL